MKISRGDPQASSILLSSSRQYFFFLVMPKLQEIASALIREVYLAATLKSLNEEEHIIGYYLDTDRLKWKVSCI